MCVGQLIGANMTAGEKTKTAMVLTFATLLAEDIGKIDNADIRDKAKKINRWATKCLDSLNIKLTPMRQKNIYRAGEKIGVALKQIVAEEDGKVSVERNFAACATMLDCLVSDLFVTVSPVGRCWDCLRVVSDTLARRSLALYPDYVECGVEAYEKAYDILEKIR